MDASLQASSKLNCWLAQRVLVIEADDERLTWPERELVRQLGEKLYGDQRKRQERRHE